MPLLVSAAFASLMTAGGILVSCSSPSGKSGDAATIELPDSMEVIGSALTGDNPEIMTLGYDDSGYLVLARALKSNKTDTVFRNDEAWQPCQVAKAKSGYVVACRHDGGNPMYGYEYAVFLSNSDDKAGKMLLIDEGNEDLTATGYVINTDSETIELSSTEDDTEMVMLYNDVYDFSGKQLSDNSRKIPIKKVSSSTGFPASIFGGGSATYLWECSRCGAKKNANTKPFGTCPDGRECKYVKIQRVD